MDAAAVRLQSAFFVPCLAPIQWIDTCMIWTVLMGMTNTCTLLCGPCRTIRFRKGPILLTSIVHIHLVTGFVGCA